jgi:arabinofuranosyltransferase
MKDVRQELQLRDAMGFSGWLRSLAHVVGERVGAGSAPAPKVVTIVGVALLAWVAARGWVSDDAAITARSIDNLLHGHGLRWNVDERVQVFTHPLWALLLIPPMAVGLSWYTALVGLGLALTALCLFETIRGARNTTAALSGLVALAGSRAFVDFSTSGLENPLANAILVGLVARAPAGAATARDVRAVSFGVSLLVLTRHDLALLGLPMLGAVCLLALRAGTPLRRVAAACVLGQLPLLSWEAFSIVYYGFPLPNTAYAKLSTGIEPLTYLELGIGYYGASLERDPWTLLAPFAFVLHAVRFRTSPLPAAVALGTLCYLAYVASIGGDFMGGRFFVAPLVCCVAVGISRHVRASPGTDPRLLGATLLVGLVCLMRPLQPLFGGRVWRVADERSHNVKGTGTWKLLTSGRSGPDNSWLRRGAEWRRAAAQESEPEGRLVVKHAHAVGMLGLAAGSRVHVIDHLAITEPFLARLPAAHDSYVIAGHFERMGQWSAPVAVTVHCPLEREVCRFWQQYTETVATGRCALQDEPACRYWEALGTVTRGELFSLERWRNIVRLNFGLIDGWIDRARYRDATRSFPGDNR